MQDVLTIPATYNNTNYYLLVQRRDLKGTMKLHVTALTEGETKIYGAYIFEVRNEIFCLISQPKGARFDLADAIARTVKENIVDVL